MIVALAGRRIDAPDAKTPRFPSEMADSVKQRLVGCLRYVKAVHLVCSAACGADLLALLAAEELMIQKTIIIPFDSDTFRSTSVTDRPGNWGLIYDTFVQQLKGSDQFITLDYDKNDPEVYEKTNFRILDHAQNLARQYQHGHRAEKKSSGRTIALIVWEGKPKDSNDTTCHFMQEAQKRNFVIQEINITP